MQRLVDKLLRHVRAVGIGRVDEIDTEFRQALQRANGLRVIRLGVREPTDHHVSVSHCLDLFESVLFCQFIEDGEDPVQ